MPGAIQVEGLNSLVRAFRVANKEVAKDVRTAIEQAGEPIRQDAQNRVRAEISGMSRSRVPWWEIRSGVERSTIGYIVPRQRGVRTLGGGRRRRPRLAALIAQREQSALDAHAGRVETEFREALNEVARAWARVR
jgi:ATPase subunit of ABC transporter with duplicated ATPase domains